VQYSDNGKPVDDGQRRSSLHAGRNVIDLPIEIRQPKLWYPGRLRRAAALRVHRAGGHSRQVSDERKVKAGLRSIVLHRELDKWGRSFEFMVNGIPVFAKGADVIPFDSFPNRVTTADYRRILQSARDANMNMIRHWGGGYYETDEFYAICDELGIMVWQDFMFGNDWQPGTYAFKQNIEAEAEDQVRRLRNHPSIVMWCGNNETEERLRVGSAPNAAARCEAPDVAGLPDRVQRHSARVVARLEPETPYWPSSPSADYEPLSDHYQSGDAHLGRMARPRAVSRPTKRIMALCHRIRLPVVPGDEARSRAFTEPKIARASLRR
jgi:beta-mannosidase